MINIHFNRLNKAHIIKVFKKIDFKISKKRLSLQQAIEKIDEDFKIIDKKNINKILSNNHLEIIFQMNHKNKIINIYRIKDKFYMFYKNPKFELFLENENIRINEIKYINIAFFIIFLSLVLSFYLTIKKLYPIKILKDYAKSLGEEKYELININTNKQDEVSLLANEFKKSAKNLQQIKQARNVFIRNIMHELKTPITKGKFLLELEHNDENNNRLKNVFYRLEVLISEFKSIEELISKSKSIEKKHYFIEDLVDNAIDILMQEEGIIKNYKNQKLNVNFKLFSIAIKNLIDNAIKYSPDKQVIIKNDEENLIFENYGNKLTYNLHDYFTPFFKNEEKQNNSFGLGLYITKNILKAHNYELKYNYIENKNIFICQKSTLKQSPN